VLFLLYSRTFPVIAQAEVKTILKSSGQRYKNIREAGGSLVGTGSDERTAPKSKPVKKTPKKKKE
jgi:molybdopterin-containing oxidoreductase family membrane subunit